MVEVTFYRDSRNRLSSVFARGHAEFAVQAEDVVCAAVSAILQAAQYGLEAYAKIPLESARDSESSEFRLLWPESAREDPAVRAIVTTAELSIERIAQQYPEEVRFIRESLANAPSEGS